MRSGNSPQLACWSILAFGFQCYNHRHHSRWEDFVVCICSLTGHPSGLCVPTFTTSIIECLARNPNKHILDFTVRAVRDGANDRVRTCDHTIISRVLYQLSYACIYGAFYLPTQAPSAGKQVFTFIQLAKVFALSISNFTCSIYIPYPASGRRSVQLLRTSSRQFMRFLLHRRIVVLRIFEFMLTFAIPTV